MEKELCGFFVRLVKMSTLESMPQVIRDSFSQSARVFGSLSPEERLAIVKEIEKKIQEETDEIFLAVENFDII